MLNQLRIEKLIKQVTAEWSSLAVHACNKNRLTSNLNQHKKQDH